MEMVTWTPSTELPEVVEARDRFRLDVERGLGTLAGLEPLPVLAQPGDKLGGWPRWSQGPAYEKCTKCRKPIDDLLFQYQDGAQAAGLVSGGRGYLLRCPTHPAELAFMVQR